MDVIEALVAGGADPNQVGGKFSASSLYVAAECNHPRVIAALVKAGADVNLVNSKGGTPLCLAASKGLREVFITASIP